MSKRIVQSIGMCAVIMGIAHGETISFGEGDLAFEIEFVHIGDPGNPPEPATNHREGTTHELGSVDYEYEIGKFEISCGQFAIAAQFIDESPVPLEESCVGDKHPKVARFQEAMQFINWLNTSEGFPPAYKLNIAGTSVLKRPLPWEPGESGYDPENPLRNSLAKFALPTADEWHKAAYFDPTREEPTYWLYAIGSNSPPAKLGRGGGTEPFTAFFRGFWPFDLVDVDAAGGLSSYGTMGQDGNAWEWEEGPFILDGDPTGQRAFRMHEGSPLTTRRVSVGGPEPGFRVVSLLTQRDPFGDFNEDGSFTDADIDFLAESIRLGSIDQAIDLNGDGFANDSDRTFWVEQIANTVFGDANLDGSVDLADFLALSVSFNQDSGWAGGDFDGSGRTDFRDFFILSENFGVTREISSVHVVPEPTGLWFAILLTLFGARPHVVRFA